MKSLTPKQAAAIIGCSTRHVRALITRGKIQAVRTFESYHIPLREVRRFALTTQSRGWPRGKSRKQPPTQE